MTAFLILESEGPMRGPWVPCRNLTGVVGVRGIVDGDRVRIVGLSAGIENGEIEVERDGEYQFGVESRDFLRAVRLGDRGRVSVWVR